MSLRVSKMQKARFPSPFLDGFLSKSIAWVSTSQPISRYSTARQTTKRPHLRQAIRDRSCWIEDEGISIRKFLDQFHQVNFPFRFARSIRAPATNSQPLRFALLINLVTPFGQYLPDPIMLSVALCTKVMYAFACGIVLFGAIVT